MPLKVEESSPQRIWDWIHGVIFHKIQHLEVAHAGPCLPMDLDLLHDDLVEVLQVEEHEVDEEGEEEDHFPQSLHKLHRDKFLWMGVISRLSFDHDFFYLRFSGHLTFAWQQTRF